MPGELLTFPTDCAVVNVLCEDIAELTPADVQAAIEKASLTTDSDTTHGLQVIEALGADSLGAINAAEAGERECATCAPNRQTICKLGSFLSEITT